MSISRDSVYDHAIAHVYNAIEISGGLWIMRNHHDGLAKIFIQPTQHLEHDVGIFCIQITSWFVGKQDFWVSDNGASDGDALLFAPGHFGGLVTETAFESEHFCDYVEAVGIETVTVNVLCNGDIAASGERGKQVETLKNKSDFAAAQLGPFGITQNR